MHKKLQRPGRPVFLNLTQIRFPITALTSIVHRLSGLLLFILIPFMLWALERSLATPEGFHCVGHFFASPVMKFFGWVFLSALAYHLVAGIRHLFMDSGIGESKQGGRAGSIIIIIVSIVLIVLAGVWIW